MNKSIPVAIVFASMLVYGGYAYAQIQQNVITCPQAGEVPITASTRALAHAAGIPDTSVCWAPKDQNTGQKSAEAKQFLKSVSCAQTIHTGVAAACPNGTRDLHIDGLNAKFAECVAGFIKQYIASGKGGSMCIRDAYRAPGEQQCAANNSANGNAVAKPGHSKHEVGLAVDLNPTNGATYTSIRSYADQTQTGISFVYSCSRDTRGNTGKKGLEDCPHMQAIAETCASASIRGKTPDTSVPSAIEDGTESSGTPAQSCTSLYCANPCPVGNTVVSYGPPVVCATIPQSQSTSQCPQGTTATLISDNPPVYQCTSQNQCQQGYVYSNGQCYSLSSKSPTSSTGAGTSGTGSGSSGSGSTGSGSSGSSGGGAGTSGRTNTTSSDSTGSSGSTGSGSSGPSAVSNDLATLFNTNTVGTSTTTPSTHTTTTSSSATTEQLAALANSSSTNTANTNTTISSSSTAISVNQDTSLVSQLSPVSASLSETGSSSASHSSSSEGQGTEHTTSSQAGSTTIDIHYSTQPARGAQTFTSADLHDTGLPSNYSSTANTFVQNTQAILQDLTNKLLSALVYLRHLVAGR